MILDHLAVPAIQWAIPSPAPVPNPPDSGENYWQAIVAAGVIVGLIVGLVQVFFWVQDRRMRRAQLRLLEIVGHQMDAERARAEAQQSATLVEQLRAQIDRDLPAEARRVYLAQRLESLAKSLTADFEEYVDIESELSPRSDVSPLHQQIRTVIEGRIVPARQREKRRERVTLIMLGILLAAALLPIDLGQLVSAHFYELAQPDYNYGGSLNYEWLLSAVTVGIIFWVTATLIAGYLFKWSDAGVRQRTGLARVVLLKHIRFAQLALFAAIVLIVGGTLLAANAVQVSSVPTGVDGSYTDYDIKEEVRAAAGTLLSVGVPLLGISLTRTIAGIWLSWPGGFRGHSGLLHRLASRRPVVK